MSDAIDEDGRFLGHQLIRKSQTESLRRQMQEFISERQPTDPKTVREQVATSGTDLSSTVGEGREDRL